MKTILAACAMMAVLSGGAAGRAQPAAQGTLHIESEPAGIEIFVQTGQGASTPFVDTGKKTPQDLKYPEGSYRVKLRSLDSKSYPFTIHAGQTTQLTIHLAS